MISSLKNQTPMKYLINIIAIVVISACIAGCGGNANASQNSQEAQSGKNAANDNLSADGKMSAEFHPRECQENHAGVSRLQHLLQQQSVGIP